MVSKQNSKNTGFFDKGPLCFANCGLMLFEKAVVLGEVSSVGEATSEIRRIVGS